MKKNQKRLRLAGQYLALVLLILENVNVALELLSKAVNYAARIRKLPAFILEERQADLRTQ